MLNFIIGRENIDLGPIHMDSPLYFRKARPEWLNDDFAKRAIKAIDQATVLNGFALEIDLVMECPVSKSLLEQKHCYL